MIHIKKKDLINVLFIKSEFMRTDALTGIEQNHLLTRVLNTRFIDHPVE